MFSFNDPRFEQFLTEWAQVLLTEPTVTAVYYIGTSVWEACDDLNFQLVPNFIVRTDEPCWDTFTSGMPFGLAAHELVNQVNQEVLQAFYERWYRKGWTQVPTTASPFIPVISDPGQHVRIIKVPASPRWAGPEYLQRIQNGLSVARNFQESLRRYNPEEHQLDQAQHYYSCDERLVSSE